MVTNAPAFLFRDLPDEAVEEIWSAGPGTIVADTFAKPVGIHAAKGGYVIDGRATFTSGCRHADWCGVLGILRDDDGPRQLQAVVPMREVQIVDNWDVLGMRGTGSDDVVFDGIFVSERFTFELGADRVSGKHYGGHLYRLPGIALTSTMSPVVLGCLRVALDELTDLAMNKVPFASSTTLRTRSIAQIHYDRALAQYRACAAYAESTYGEAWRRAANGEETTAEQRASIALCAAFVTEKTAAAVRELTTAAGTSSIYKRNRIERASRDIDVLRHHGWSNESRYGSVAQIYWGLETDFPLIHF
jgi:alkylation response protein AidB-like acyl-CoA dehydrogenase